MMGSAPPEGPALISRTNSCRARKHLRGSIPPPRVHADLFCGLQSWGLILEARPLACPSWSWSHPRFLIREPVQPSRLPPWDSMPSRAPARGHLPLGGSGVPHIPTPASPPASGLLLQRTRALLPYEPTANCQLECWLLWPPPGPQHGDGPCPRSWSVHLGTSPPPRRGHAAACRLRHGENTCALQGNRPETNPCSPTYKPSHFQ